MLRDPTLIPLSHQHQHGLALCVLSRRSLAADPSEANVARVAKRVVDRYEVEIANHFEVEEQVLFPACGPLPIIEELLTEHRAMQTMVEQLRTSASAELVESFFALLMAHIRREESELFEKIQQDLPRETLDRAGAEIERRVVRVCLDEETRE